MAIVSIIGGGGISAQTMKRDSIQLLNIAPETKKTYGGNMDTAPVLFEPKTVYDYFMGITRRPHPSANQKNVTGNEDPVRQYVVEQARMIPGVEVVFYKPDANKPGDRVIVLRRSGKGNYARKSPVILQAHLDMVYNPATMEFPLNVILDKSQPDGKWIKALDRNDRSSTFGADDGIGLAAALALLKDTSLKDFPIECLFTVQEETDMDGAKKCNVKNLTGNTLLNLDAEDLKVIIYGSAGGAETMYSNDITRFNCPSGYVNLRISISGLRGGHSGIDINKGRLNAIKAIAQILVRLNNRIHNTDAAGGIGSYSLYLHDLKRTDVLKANAIPGSAEAIVAVPRDQADSFKMDFTAYCESMKSQYRPVENQFTYSVDATDAPLQPLDDKSTDAVLCIISQIPTGVVSMIPEVPDVVETSSNLYNVTIKNGAAAIESLSRSSNERSLKAFDALQSNIGKIFNFRVKTGMNRYVSWQPNHNSRVLKVTSEVYRKMYGDDVRITVVHAGLECGALSSRFYSEKQVTLDCVSIGPTVRNPHTGNETLEIESKEGIQTVRQFYHCVCEIVRGLYR